MQIFKTNSGNKVVLRLEGRLDTSTSSTLEKELAAIFDAGEANVALDMADLVYVSSAGLRVLLAAHKKCAAKGGELVVYNVANVISEVFRVTGFANILNIK